MEFKTIFQSAKYAVTMPSEANEQVEACLALRRSIAREFHTLGYAWLCGDAGFFSRTEQKVVDARLAYLKEAHERVLRLVAKHLTLDLFAVFGVALLESNLEAKAEDEAVDKEKELLMPKAKFDEMRELLRVVRNCEPAPLPEATACSWVRKATTRVVAMHLKSELLAHAEQLTADRKVYRAKLAQRELQAVVRVRIATGDMGCKAAARKVLNSWRS